MHTFISSAQQFNTHIDSFPQQYTQVNVQFMYTMYWLKNHQGHSNSAFETLRTSN